MINFKEIIPILYAVVLPLSIVAAAMGYYIYWLFNKKAKQRHLDILRAQLEKLSPTDPEYNNAKNLYTSALAESAIHSNSSDFDPAGYDDGSSDGGDHH